MELKYNNICDQALRVDGFSLHFNSDASKTQTKTSPIDVTRKTSKLMKLSTHQSITARRLQHHQNFESVSRKIKIKIRHKLRSPTNSEPSSSPWR